ncbi:MAG: hypothetical protein II603_09545 [Muribaculaceae bacterium]|nr:hypothetical protein [Muribaculaceae bacterium]
MFNKNVFGVDLGTSAVKIYSLRKNRLMIEHNIIVDELGREPMPANNFGTKMNVMQHIIQMRYDNRRSCVTHVTTNMAPTDVAKYYGSYVADRCVEMFNFINLNGTSLRQ